MIDSMGMRAFIYIYICIFRYYLYMYYMLYKLVLIYIYICAISTVYVYIYICYNVDIVVFEGIDVFIPGGKKGILHGDISIVGYNQVDMTFGCV